MRSLREAGQRAAFDGRTHDPILSLAPVDLTCIAIALDARAEPFLERNLADVAHGDMLSRLRHAAGLLRRVRAVWLGAGIYVQLGIDPGEAEKQFAQCRREARRVPGAVAIRATLSVTTRDELVVPPRARWADDVRFLLEAIENTETPPTDVLAIDLSLGPIDPVDPWLVIDRQPWRDQPFCPQCAVPLPPGLDRCPECAAILSTWREN